MKHANKGLNRSGDQDDNVAKQTRKRAHANSRKGARPTVVMSSTAATTMTATIEPMMNEVLFCERRTNEAP